MTCLPPFSFHRVVSPKKAVFEGDRFLKLGGGRFRLLQLCVHQKLFKKTSRFGWAAVEGVGARAAVELGRTNNHATFQHLPRLIKPLGNSLSNP